MRALNRLSAASVKAGRPGKFNDGGGLWLHRREDGGAQWFLRVTVAGRRREMGLGSLASVSLKAARDEAAKWRTVAAGGRDPIKERERLRREAAAIRPTLETVAREAFEARKAQLKADGKAGRWFSPLELHVLPKLGKTPIEDIDQSDIKTVLAPIWHAKGETARKAMTRLKVVMKHAVAMDLDVDLQATDKAQVLLGKSRQTTEHIAAITWQDVPKFYATLTDGSICHLALRLLILTAARSAEVRFVRLDEIDGSTWIIPAERMKGGVEHRIPLSNEALAVIEQAKPMARNGFLFPNVRKGVISDATMSRMMERRGMKERPHGFRSSFRDWCAEATSTPREVAEAALAHRDGNKVERAYRRTDYLEQRRALMHRWADHVTSRPGRVVELRT
ncbi:MAG: tyrosine-type recombinase/integrase [Amaricoccus sp.]